MQPNSQSRSVRIAFVPEITMGNVLSAFMMVVTVLVWGLRLEGRVDAETKVRDEQYAEIQRQFVAIESLRTDDMREIKATLVRIESKLDEKADKK